MSVEAAISGRICTVRCLKVTRQISLAGMSEVFSGRTGVSILGGASLRNQAGRYHYWACDPLEVFEFKAGQVAPLEAIDRVLSRYKHVPDDKDRLPGGAFACGWIGYFGYELGRYIEILPQSTVDDMGLPIIRLCFYDRVICYDSIERCVWLIALEMDDDVEEKLAGLGKLLNEAKNVSINPPKPVNLQDIDFSRIHRNMTKSQYMQAVGCVKRYIYEGDTYQINLSQRFDCDFAGRGLDLYLWQNHYNPSPYAAYIDAGDFEIVSASPEMFISIVDGCIQTRPIKGTRPRMPDGNKGKNSANFQELLVSEKDKAELNMIVDLERNDLARICVPGTRKVSLPRTIETYATVFHAAATIEGQLKKDTAFSDILRAVFPGGSITGAPKIRSMEIIDELEPTHRGVYTGSIGFLGIDGNVCLNIAIRTIIIKADKAFVQTGGGIVADSEAENEWDECLTKARALIAGIYATRKK
ncbi:MAG: anthranilate synthase component I family protein [Planctomycetota bacterium]